MADNEGEKSKTCPGSRKKVCPKCKGICASAASKCPNPTCRTRFKKKTLAASMEEKRRKGASNSQDKKKKQRGHAVKQLLLAGAFASGYGMKVIVCAFVHDKVQLWSSGLTDGMMRGLASGVNPLAGKDKNNRDWEGLCRVSDEASEDEDEEADEAQRVGGDVLEVGSEKENRETGSQDEEESEIVEVLVDGCDIEGSMEEDYETEERPLTDLIDPADTDLAALLESPQKSDGERETVVIKRKRKGQSVQEGNEVLQGDDGKVRKRNMPAKNRSKVKGTDENNDRETNKGTDEGADKGAIYPVEKIVRMTEKDGQRMFLIRWKGFGRSDDSFIDELEARTRLGMMYTNFMDKEANRKSKKKSS